MEFSKDLTEIVKLFKENGFDIKIAGGAVRDMLLQTEPKDIDLATTATPDEMVLLLKDFRTIPTGLQHGTITVLGKETSEEFEITTLRIDSNQDGRHADVHWTTDFKEDAARRDLTYNAMFMDLDGTLYDFFNGAEDLKNGVTRAVGSPLERFQEDHLRILRAFRFSARFNHVLSDETLEAITKTASDLKQISGERIWMEMQKILSTEAPFKTVQEMIHTGVATEIGLNITHFENLELAEHKDPVLTLAGIVNKTEADQLSKSWKLSSDHQRELQFLTTAKTVDWSTTDAERFIAMHKDPVRVKAMMVKVFMIQGKTDTISSFDIPVFPLKGRDLIQAGMKPGKEMGVQLKNLKELWAASNFTLTKEELMS